MTFRMIFNTMNNWVWVFSFSNIFTKTFVIYILKNITYKSLLTKSILFKKKNIYIYNYYENIKKKKNYIF